jgi:hypothetical protein
VSLCVFSCAASLIFYSTAKTRRHCEKNETEDLNENENQENENALHLVAKSSRMTGMDICDKRSARILFYGEKQNANFIIVKISHAGIYNQRLNAIYH